MRASRAPTPDGAAEALPLLEEAYRLCVAAKIAFLMPVVGTSLGYAKALLGRDAEAIADLERATLLARQTRLAYAIAWSTCHFYYAYFSAGSCDKARAVLEEALRISIEHEYGGVQLTVDALMPKVTAMLGMDRPAT